MAAASGTPATTGQGGPRHDQTANRRHGPPVCLHYRNLTLFADARLPTATVQDVSTAPEVPVIFRSIRIDGRQNEQLMTEYQDRWIECDAAEIRIRGYYFPWGTKHIPYGSIRSLRRVDLSAARGRGRIWGTANPRYWANLDPRRPSKHCGLIVDVGRFVHPFITPDDCDAVETLIRRFAKLDGTASGQDQKGPIV